MIDYTDNFMPVAEIDLGRPNLLDESKFVYWRNFHAFMKESSIAIRPCAAFVMIEQYLQTGESYAGGGMAYKFWFRSDDERLAFIKSLPPEFNATDILLRQIGYKPNAK